MEHAPDIETRVERREARVGAHSDVGMVAAVEAATDELMVALCLEGDEERQSIQAVLAKHFSPSPVSS